MALRSNPLEWDNESWRDRAACRWSDAALFFPAGSTGTAMDQVQAAKAVCTVCPVIDSCLLFALESRQEAGVWGGKDEQERRRILGRARRDAQASV
jgi:WhiB family redox-sensing transcriptional regulator